MRLLQQGLGSLRGAIGTPDQIADLIARYEAAGVDQVIFVCQAGPNRHEHICESLELFAAEVMPRVRRAAPRSASARRPSGSPERSSGPSRGARRPRVADPDYVVKPDARAGARRRDRRRPAATASAERRPRELVARAGESGFAALVRNRSDAQLHRLFDRGPGVGVIFKGMERAFVADQAKGFEGEIHYELEGRDGPGAGRCGSRDGRARARRGPASDRR